MTEEETIPMQDQRSRSFRRGTLRASLLLSLFAMAAIARAGQPVASFTWSPGSPTSGNEVSFTDHSTENPTSGSGTSAIPRAGR
jgi:PKD repeat protein